MRESIQRAYEWLPSAVWSADPGARYEFMSMIIFCMDRAGWFELILQISTEEKNIFQAK